MSEWLLIRLAPAAPDSDSSGSVADLAAWMLVDAAGHLVAPPAMAALATLAPQAIGRRVAVIVPGVDVLALEVDVPPLGGAKLLQAVPFALEEQVADDVDTLHFAVGARSPQGRAAVRIVSKALFADWLERLAAAGLSAQVLFDDASLLPGNAGQAVALLEGSELCLRVGARAPLYLPIDGLDAALTLAFAAPDADVPNALTALDPAWPALTLYAGPDDWERVAPQFESLRHRFAAFRVQLLPNGALPLLAARAVLAQQAAGAPINLLQGVHAPRGGTARAWRPWRLAAGLAAAALLLFVGSQALEYRQLRQTENALDSAIAEVARATFPGESPSGDLRARIEQQLLAVRSGGGDAGPWLRALVALAQARGASPDAEFQSVGLEATGIDVRVKASSAESLERINSALRASGWQAELQGGTASESAYEGRIRLRTQEAQS
jgi:general secretion pathway protein L